MNASFVRPVVHALVICMICLPIQSRAGLIGTGESVSPVQAARETVGRFIERSNVADQLRARGISSSDAHDRVAALTDAEVADLAGQIGQLPAGAGFAIGTIGVIMIIGYLLYRYWREVLLPSPR